MKKIAMAMALASMIMPAVAQEAPLSTVGEQKNEAKGTLAMILALAILAGGVYLAVDGDDEQPISN